MDHLQVEQTISFTHVLPDSGRHATLAKASPRPPQEAASPREMLIEMIGRELWSLGSAASLGGF